MSRVLGMCLAVLCFASAVQAAPPPPTRAANDNGAYVILGSPPDNGIIDFKYGWNTSAQFDSPATAIFVGIYDVTRSYYLWNNELPLPQIQAPAPGSQTTESVEFRYADPTTRLAPGVYCINFFVRKGPGQNTAVVQLFFTVK